MENDTYSMYSKFGSGTISLMDPEPVMSLGTEKVVILMAMTMITLVFGLLPYKLLGQVRNNQDTVSRARWRLLISLCTCVSGGVFLAACLLDLFPETEEKLAGQARQLLEVADVSTKESQLLHDKLDRLRGIEEGLLATFARDVEAELLVKGVSSYERLLVHAASAYYSLSSCSTEVAGSRVVRVANRGHFCLRKPR